MLGLGLLKGLKIRALYTAYKDYITILNATEGWVWGWGVVVLWPAYGTVYCRKKTGSSVLFLYLCIGIDILKCPPVHLLGIEA